MKQLIQNYKAGEIQLVEVPVPQASKNSVLVQTLSSLISLGTERYMLEFARKSLVLKASSRPDLVKQIIAKAQTEGPLEAYRQAMARLDMPVPLGYSAAGVVIDVGENIREFAIGDRVACAGSGYASHAEIIRMPKNLVVKIPDPKGRSPISFEEAAFVALGAIAIHAVRVANLTFGERVIVLGLGLLGQLAIQILRAIGCRVMGLDIVPEKVHLALEHGADAGAVVGKDDILSEVLAFSDGQGADAVLVFSATESNEPIELAAEIAREKGKIVVPGLVGLNIPRKLFYEKELELVVSRAWGPGMYDQQYEEGKIDYPFAFVRWTAQRNMAHFLEILADGRITVTHLISHRFPIERALEAYELILKKKEKFLGVIINYPGEPNLSKKIEVSSSRTILKEKANQKLNQSQAKPFVNIALIGAGQFARGTILPILSQIKQVNLRAVVTSSGITGQHIAKKYGFTYFSTDIDYILNDPEINLVMILTRHDSHAPLVCKALSAGKHVFVEKPLAISLEQLRDVVNAFKNHPSKVLMVGFNRRFAPTTAFAMERLKRVPKPFIINARANIGYIPPDSWVHDSEQGGGNIIGEVCHFIDLIQALTESYPTEVYARAVRSESKAIVPEDNIVITLMMADGSVGNIVYTALGNKRYPRERVEIFGGGAVCVIDNFKTAIWTQAGRRERFGWFMKGVDRGHRAEMQFLINEINKGIKLQEYFESYIYTTLSTLSIKESLIKGTSIKIAPNILF